MPSDTLLEQIEKAIEAPWYLGVAIDLKEVRNCILHLQEERDSFKGQAEYERQARITAADFPRNRHGYIPCERCGLDCGMDAIVPNDVWAQITPVPEFPEGGMLCLWCMDELCVERGVEGPVTVKLYYPGKVLLSWNLEK